MGLTVHLAAQLAEGRFEVEHRASQDEREDESLGGHPEPPTPLRRPWSDMNARHSEAQVHRR
jgi:hypothetical protein